MQSPCRLVELPSIALPAMRITAKYPTWGKSSFEKLDDAQPMIFCLLQREEEIS